MGLCYLLVFTWATRLRIPAFRRSKPRVRSKPLATTAFAGGYLGTETGSAKSDGRMGGAELRTVLKSLDTDWL